MNWGKILGIIQRVEIVWSAAKRLREAVRGAPAVELPPVETDEARD